MHATPADARSHNGCALALGLSLALAAGCNPPQPYPRRVEAPAARATQVTARTASPPRLPTPAAPMVVAPAAPSATADGAAAPAVPVVRAEPAPAPAPASSPAPAPAPSAQGNTAPLPPAHVGTRAPRPEPAPLGPVALAGCPPPPRPRGPRAPRPRPWRPTVLIREETFPEPAPPAPRRASLRVLEGSGVWIWRARQCENGDADAIVERAVRAGMRQIWVRVGDSHDGFYAAALLETLVPRAHAAGLAVIGWGFPYLWDPASDAAWTRAALEWRAASGETLDAFSPDIETASEGTRLSARRVVLYLSLVRPLAARTARPLIATVFRPTAHWLRAYPYREMAPYIDAFAPMVYWSCAEPGAAGANAVRALAALAPVHVIGQGYDMEDEGGRAGAPSGVEIARFCDASRRAGALGASLWHWTSMTPEEWSALGECWWPADGPRGVRRARANGRQG